MQAGSKTKALLINYTLYLELCGNLRVVMWGYTGEWDPQNSSSVTLERCFLTRKRYGGQSRQNYG